MGNACRMSGSERACDLRGYIKRLSELQSAARQSFPESHSIDKLHGNAMEVPGVSAVINGDYVRVIQCRRGACFLLEAAQTISVPGELCGKHFKRDPPPELRILGEKDRPHSTAAERF